MLGLDPKSKISFKWFLGLRRWKKLRERKREARREKSEERRGEMKEKNGGGEKKKGNGREQRRKHSNQGRLVGMTGIDSQVSKQPGAFLTEVLREIRKHPGWAWGELR